MSRPDLNDVVAALRASWCAETCDQADVDDWSPDNPSRGHCGTTALVLNDFFGGHLMLAEVLRADGSRQGYHYWNVLADGTELDLTLEQFDEDETVQPGRVVERPPERPRRSAEQYDVLRDRVLRYLDMLGGEVLPP